MNETFVIVSVNGEDVTNVEDLSRILSNSQGPIRLEGMYPGYDGLYTYPLNLEQ